MVATSSGNVGEELQRLLATYSAWANSHLVPQLKLLSERLASVDLQSLKLAIAPQQLHEHIRFWEHEVPAILKDSVDATGLLVPISQISFLDLKDLMNRFQSDGLDGVAKRVGELYEDIFARTNFLPLLAPEWSSHSLTKRRISGSPQTGHVWCIRSGTSSPIRGLGRGRDISSGKDGRHRTQGPHC